jgi:hypothetical protein
MTVDSRLGFTGTWTERAGVPPSKMTVPSKMPSTKVPGTAMPASAVTT